MPDDAIPERRLILATLNSGVEDACIPPNAGGERGRARDEARMWIASDARHPFSFRWCLEMSGLGNSADRIRAAIYEDRYGVVSRMKRRGVRERDLVRATGRGWPEMAMRAHRR